MNDGPRGHSELHRRLGLTDSVMIGLGSMVGAGIFAALAPAAAAAGSGLLIALGLAAVLAYCNATSSARLAARYPQSGGTYVYGRERLRKFWGYLAGWGFVVGKTASCAAMALTIGAYAWPDHARVVAVGAVACVTAVDYVGVQKSAFVTRIIVAVVFVVLAGVVVACLFGPGATGSTPAFDMDGGGILQATGLLFFAFAGYARIATLGEEVRDPRTTIPRAITIALAIALFVYAIVAAAVVYALGSNALATASDPLAQAVRAAGVGWLEPAVRIGAIVAATGSLLALVLGVSRTTLAMARDGNLPTVLGAVHPKFGVPYRAELAVGFVVAALAMTVDLREAIGFSSFAVLVYYLIANASAWTLTAAEGRPPRWVPAVGAVGCTVVALALPAQSVLIGLAVLLVGAVVWFLRAPH